MLEVGIQSTAPPASWAATAWGPVKVDPETQAFQLGATPKPMACMSSCVAVVKKSCARAGSLRCRYQNTSWCDCQKQHIHPMERSLLADWSRLRLDHDLEPSAAKRLCQMMLHHQPLLLRFVSRKISTSANKTNSLAAIEQIAQDANTSGSGAC